jgi:xanthine dehydrogenase YagT iron-sulfur-binding subunit
MRLTVNGRTCQLDVAPDATLLSVLRDQLQLTGAKPACERGECGACTVLVADPDGKPEPVYSCLALAHAHEDDRVTTIEGLSDRTGPHSMHPVQAAFVEHDAVQCGFCTPGQVLAAVALLDRDPDPSDEAIVRAMSGNLCRCGTYPKIIRAIQSAALTMRAMRAMRAMRGSNGD